MLNLFYSVLQPMLIVTSVCFVIFLFRLMILGLRRQNRNHTIRPIIDFKEDVVPLYKKYKTLFILSIFSFFSFAFLSMASNFIFMREITSFNYGADKHIIFNGKDITALNDNFIEKLKSFSLQGVGDCYLAPKRVKLIYDKNELDVYICTSDYNYGRSAISLVDNKFARYAVGADLNINE